MCVCVVVLHLLPHYLNAVPKVFCFVSFSSKRSVWFKTTAIKCFVYKGHCLLFAGINRNFTTLRKQVYGDRWSHDSFQLTTCRRLCINVAGENSTTFILHHRIFMMLWKLDLARVREKLQLMSAGIMHISCSFVCIRAVLVLLYCNSVGRCMSHIRFQLLPICIFLIVFT